MFISKERLGRIESRLEDHSNFMCGLDSKHRLLERQLNPREGDAYPTLHYVVNQMMEQWLQSHNIAATYTNSEKIKQLQDTVRSLAEIKTRKAKKDKWLKSEPKEPVI